MAIRGIFERPPRSGVWWISYCDGEGKRHREKAGRRAAALDALGRRRLEVREGRFIPPRAGGRLTFRELATAAMVQKKLHLAPSSYETDQLRLGKLLPLIGSLPADQLTSTRIEETLAHLRQSVSKSTANRYHALISSIYKFAVKGGRLAVNPAAKVSRYKENDERIRWLTVPEEMAIREWLVSDTHEAEFDLALHTGMRRGEQFFLQWKNVDLERGQLLVSGKTGRRDVTANTRAVAALEKLAAVTAGAKYVCPDAHDGLERDSRRWFEAAVKKSGVEDFHWHDLRHTFASRSLMGGADIRAVQILLGHKSIVMTMKYAHLAKDHQQEAAEKMVKRKEVPRRGKKAEVKAGEEEKAGKEKAATAESDRSR